MRNSCKEKNYKTNSPFQLGYDPAQVLWKCQYCLYKLAAYNYNTNIPAQK